MRVHEASGWPESFLTDLTTHDRTCLASDQAPEQFVWVLRRNGTHLWDHFDPYVKTELEYLLKHDEPLLFVYDGQTLKRATVQEARELLTKRNERIGLRQI